MTTITFDDALPTDSIPPSVDVEYPCEKCGNETGWSGRGRRKKYCDNCRPTRQSSGGSGVRVTGKTNELASQAAKTLASINAVMAMGIGALGFFRTMAVAMDKNEDFEKAAYAALITDPKLAQQILTVGETSGKITLGLAYISWGMGIGPTLMTEYREKKEARIAGLENL